jgi:hypothetical protein
MLINIQVFQTATKWQLANSLAHNCSLLNVEALSPPKHQYMYQQYTQYNIPEGLSLSHLFVIQYCESQQTWSFQ